MQTAGGRIVGGGNYRCWCLEALRLGLMWAEVENIGILCGDFGLSHG